MFFILSLLSLILFNDGMKTNVIEKDFSFPIEKLLLVNNELFLGTTNALHRLSSDTLQSLQPSMNLSSSNFHWKILLSIDEKSLLICGTTDQGSCQMINHQLEMLISSSMPVVANDPINSSLALIVPEKQLIYFAVTYNHQGKSRWLIPNLCARSFNRSNWMKIPSNNEENLIARDDLSLRFLPRQQINFIVQYIFTFSSSNYLYWISNQPNDLDDRQIRTKILRLCRKSSSSIIHSYSEMPLICGNADWIMAMGQIIENEKNETILIGLFHRLDQSAGTKICSWNIQKEIDQEFYRNYHRCYSKGLGERGLNFIKPNEPCRKDENWFNEIEDWRNICPSLSKDRLISPLGVPTGVHGHLIYENALERSSALKVHPLPMDHSSSFVLFQGLTNGTWKLGIFDHQFNIHWFYSDQISTQSAIDRDVLYYSSTSTFFFASKSKIYRFSLNESCASSVSCDECLSSSKSFFCRWCSNNDRRFSSMTQCSKILHLQPENFSLEQIQSIEITLTHLRSLEANEHYQCLFSDRTDSIRTEAIRIDSTHISCRPPSFNRSISSLKMNFTLIQWPSGKVFTERIEYLFYNCSFYSSSQSCSTMKECFWCFNRCSSICQNVSFDLFDRSHRYLPSNQSISIPLKFDQIDRYSHYRCRLNESIIGSIDDQGICHFQRSPPIETKNFSSIYLHLDLFNVSMGKAIEMFLYRCDSFDQRSICDNFSSCQWCDGQCSSIEEELCSKSEPSSSILIEDFFPKQIPIDGGTVLTIRLNEQISFDQIEQIILIDIPCSIISMKTLLQCRTNPSNSSRSGSIRIYLKNSFILISNHSIEYLQPLLHHFHPKEFFQLGGQILNLYGENLFIGTEQKIFLNSYRCLSISSSMENVISCRLPSLPSGIYRISFRIDSQTIRSFDESVIITPNPIVQEISPINSFISGGRLITVNGFHFTSAQGIFVEFSNEIWRKKFQIDRSAISNSSFQFRSPSIPSTIRSNRISLQFSIDFDHLISLTNLIQFDYFPDLTLNLSSTLPILPFTGEDLRINIENLTDVVSIDEIQLFIGCSSCPIRSLTSKGMTCQPPKQMQIEASINVNDQHPSIDCRTLNQSIGPIRLRIGFREYLIGHLSYQSSISSSYSISTWIYLFTSICLLISSLIISLIYLCFKLRKTRDETRSMSPRRNDVQQREKSFWSTTTSATILDGTTTPLYQIYEQIPSVSFSTSSIDNPFRRTPFIHCPFHSQQTLKMEPTRLRTISIHSDRLKYLFLQNENRSVEHSSLRPSMELFYDLLEMKAFRQAFLHRLIEMHRDDLLVSYFYLFRWNSSIFDEILLKKSMNIFKFLSTLYSYSEKDLIECFQPLDDFISSLIDFLHSSPSDQILHRSTNSFHPSHLLILPPSFHCESISIPMIYENSLHFDVTLFDCDTMDQVKEKFLHLFYSSGKTSTWIDEEQLDIFLPPLNFPSFSSQIPMIKDYSFNAIFIHRTSSNKSSFNPSFEYHLIRESQLINDREILRAKAKENKKSFQPILNRFYDEILRGLKLFSLWEKQSKSEHFFDEYIQLISELLRRLPSLMIYRSKCPLLHSTLHLIADGLETIFLGQSQCSAEIDDLFEDEKRSYASWHRTNFHLSTSSTLSSTTSSNCYSSIRHRSMIFSDDRAIESLHQLYQFYQCNSQAINEHIGEYDVSVLVPVHHLLLQIRQMTHSSTTII